MIARLPSQLLCLLFMIATLLCSQYGLTIFHKWHRSKSSAENNEVAGIVFATIALIYSLILTFVIVAVWDDYNELAKTIESETDGLNSILAHSSTLPYPLKQTIGSSIDNYCTQVLNEEWKMLDTKPTQASAIPKLREILLNTEPQNAVQERISEVIDANLSRITELRRDRLNHAHSQIPQLIWQILLAGSILLILFSYFFHVRSLKLKRVFLSFLVSSVSMCMFLVYSLDHPFNDDSGISKKSFQNVQNEIKIYLQKAPKIS